MRYFLLFLLFFPVLQSTGQVNCIVSPSDTTLCYRDSIAFQTTVTGTRPYTYQWLKNGVLISSSIDSILVIKAAGYKDTASYVCIVTNGVSTDTSNTARLRLHPRMFIDTLYRYNDLGCSGSCKGQFKALVSGGAPAYTFEWGGGFSQDTIVFGLCQGKYTFTVTDTNHCSLDSSYYVDVLKSPKIDFTSQPTDTVYLTNPVVNVSFSDTAYKYLTNWEWVFKDSTLRVAIPNMNPASYAYTKAFSDDSISLHITDLNGCDTVIRHSIIVKVAKLNIPNVFTPDQDPQALNETFMITLNDSPEKNFAEVYLSNELVILDRWGRKVYSKQNYNSNNKKGDWDGGNLSDGVYFYLLKCHGYYGDEVFKGSVTILRSH
jgi:hypothetical protein